MAISFKGSMVIGPRRSTVIQPEFIMLVKTDNAGTSASDQFTIPTSGTGYNYDVDWGDGTTDTGLTGNITHTFSGGAGTYTVKISGDFPRIYFNNGGDKLKLLEVQNWGNIVWLNMTSAFLGCSNMDITATDSPDLGAVTIMSQMLRLCTSMVGNASLNNWNTSNIVSMYSMFSNTTNFNQDIGSWNVSNVNDMSYMFNGSNFNQDIGSWDVSNVNSLFSMFRSAQNFNNNGSSSIGNWNTSNVTDFRDLFLGAYSFNQDIGNWDFSNASGSQSQIFRTALSFNQYLGNWQLNTGLTSLLNMFNSTAMSTANYTDTLVAWANQVITNGGPFNLDFSGQLGRTFDTSGNGGANFANAGDARTYLTTATPSGAGWTISSDTVI